jgi:ABC-type transport system substrate-binding protein
MARVRLWLVPSLVAVLAASCSQDGGPSSIDEAPLRLGTSWTLAPLTATTTGTFTRHLVELVFQPALDEPFARLERRGLEVRLTPRDGFDPTPLVPLFAHPDLRAVRRDGAAVVLTFADEAAAASISLASTIILDGPYAVDAESAERIVLARRRGDGPSTIEAHNFATEDEVWRQLMAGRIDLITTTGASEQAHLAEVPSLRIVPVAEPSQMALWMNCERGPMADVALRRMVSLALRREPLAMAVNGDVRLAIDVHEDFEEARFGLTLRPIERPLRLVAYRGDGDRAALVVEQQLAAAGLPVVAEMLDGPQLQQALTNGDFDLLLFFGMYSPRVWPVLQSGSPRNISHYANPAFDAALAAGDDEAMRRIAEQDVPFTPLYVIPEAAVVRRTWCNLRPRVSFDLRWLADVHPCAPGEDD